MKYVIATILLALLIVLPALSWYYLHTGLEYRKGLLHSLEEKGSVLDFLDVDNVLLKGKTSLIELTNDTPLDSKKKIFEQYKEGNTFQYVARSEQVFDGENVVIADYRFKNDSLTNYDYLLVDSALVVRNLFSTDSSDKIKDMIAQISVLLPQRKNGDIIQK